LQLEHNSGELVYRKPFGACPVDTKIRLRIAVNSFSIPDKVLCITQKCEITMHYAFETNGSRMYECFIEAPSSAGLVFYYFYVCADGEECYYGNNSLCLGGVGEVSSSIPENRFQITVYSKEYKTPDWMKKAVVYQIFPDRFYRGTDTPFHGIQRKWEEEPYYLPEQFGGEYLSNDFFGGNFEGIRQKLPYLAELGITAVYLNPISKAFSNHRYDTGDYETPDPLLGSLEDFKNLAKDAKRLGIKIILDGVFSHTGADSRYFNKFNNYDSTGAYQSESSPYYSWYSFSGYPDKYESWWGFDTLPNVNELDENFVSYIATDKNSVIRKWLRNGADGFRLDVADELPDEFIRILRTALKDEKEDALLIGEVWEDASHKVSYGARREFLWGKELDSAMNYVFREAVLSYLTGADARLFSMRINSLLENYPLQSLYTSMNLISSHDVPRALTVLSDAPDFRSLSREEQHDYKISPEKLTLAKRRMVLAIALQMTMPGAPTIYYGDEKGMTGFADPFNRAPMDWESEPCELFYQTKLLSKLRKENACLSTGFYKTLYYQDGVICYMRFTQDGKDAFGESCTDGSIIVIINASDSFTQLSLNLDRFYTIRVKDALCDTPICEGGTLSLSLEPLSYRVLVPERKNNICTKIQSTQ